LLPFPFVRFSLLGAGAAGAVLAGVTTAYFTSGTASANEERLQDLDRQLREARVTIESTRAVMESTVEEYEKEMHNREYAIVAEYQKKLADLELTISSYERRMLAREHELIAEHKLALADSERRNRMHYANLMQQQFHILETKHEESFSFEQTSDSAAQLFQGNVDLLPLQARAHFLRGNLQPYTRELVLLP
jgi:hypothetical protein